MLFVENYGIFDVFQKEISNSILINVGICKNGIYKSVETGGKGKRYEIWIKMISNKVLVDVKKNGFSSLPFGFQHSWGHIGLEPWNIILLYDPN